MTTNHLQGHCIARLVWRAFSLELHLPSKIYRHGWRSVTFPTYFYYQSHFLWKGFGRIIGISKRCCPTCQQLLLLLGTGKVPFVVRGSHSTVTACTLPTWLPAHVVDSMNNIFGDRLRRELLNLIESSELLRKRAQSTGSQRLSSDSTEQPGNDNPISMSKDFLRRAGVGRE